MTMRLRLAATLVGLAATGAVPALAADAGWVGLASDNRLVTIDTGSAKVTRTVKIEGVQGSVLGIDVRPKDGKLYAITSLGDIYTVDPATGRTMLASQPDKPLDLGAAPAVDFNPVADRLRVLGRNGASYRINVDTGQVAVDGSLKYDGADMHAGKTPMVTAAAYTNSMPGAKETALYDIDAALGVLSMQAPPNDGILKSKGMLGGIKITAFDILADGKGGNVGYAVAGRSLYSIDLASAKTTKVADLTGLPGDLMDIAALPGQ